MTDEIKQQEITPPITPPAKPENKEDVKTDGAGRPTVMTKEVVSKLEAAFAYGATVKEACLHANISRQTYYVYIKQNPEFNDRFEQLMATPILKARKKIVEEIESDINTAKWYIERKCKKEFSPRVEVDQHTSEKTFEDILDEYENDTNENINQENENDQQPIDSTKQLLDPGQTGATGEVSNEPSATVLLGTQNPAQPMAETPAEGA